MRKENPKIIKILSTSNWSCGALAAPPCNGAEKSLPLLNDDYFFLFQQHKGENGRMKDSVTEERSAYAIRMSAPRSAKMTPRPIFEGKTLRFDQTDIRAASAPFAARMKIVMSGAMKARL